MKKLIILSIIFGIIFLRNIADTGSQPLAASQSSYEVAPTAIPTIVDPSERATKIALLIKQVFSESDWATLLQNHDIAPSTIEGEINEYALWMDANPDVLTKNETIILTYLSENGYQSENSDENNNIYSTPDTVSTYYNDNSNTTSKIDSSLKYNAFNNNWEYAGDDESLKYNTFEDTWEYAGDDESTKYNAMEDRWEYASDDESPQYNAFENSWEYAPSDSVTKYNSFENTWETTSSDSTLKYNAIDDNWSYEE